LDHLQLWHRPAHRRLRRLSLRPLSERLSLEVSGHKVRQEQSEMPKASRLRWLVT
jgi:hypothetical protein